MKKIVIPPMRIDLVMKAMAAKNPQQFVRFVFPDVKFKIVSVSLDKELRIRTRIVDKVFKLRDRRREYLLHFEFLTRYKTKIAEDIFIYSGGLTNNYKLKTISIVSPQLWVCSADILSAVRMTALRFSTED
jgi:hypothetical protein